jgi:hypothetical protein
VVGAEDILITLAEKLIADVEATTPLRPMYHQASASTIPRQVSHAEVPKPLHPTYSIVGGCRREVREWMDEPALTLAEGLEVGILTQRGGVRVFIDSVLLDERRFADVLVLIADEWSEVVGKALIPVMGVEAARTWPRCPRHDHAMDPVVEEDRALWACRDDRRVRVPIGQLAPSEQNDSTTPVRNL